VASGCGGHYAAWFLNLNAFALGLGIAPRAVYRAFMRGRSTSNLYTGQFDESLLAKRVGTTRRELRLDGSMGLPLVVDQAVFTVWAVTAALCLVAPFACVAAVLVLGALWLQG
jgi:hypothetical protein